MHLAVTGHRPQRLISFNQPDAHIRLVQFAMQCMSKLKATYITTGMAIGWDQACAEAAICLNIPFTAAIPFPQQPARWNTPDVVRWSNLRSQAHVVYYVANDFSLDAFKLRNEWIVDRCDEVLALWDHQPAGGTYHAITHAEKQGKRVNNVWDTYLELEAF